MRYCSWDIGKKNLAMCILETYKENECLKFSILDWKILDISADFIMCKYCNKCASLQYDYDNVTINICGSHKDEYYQSIMKNIYINSKQKCNQNKCKKFGEYSHNNNSYCEKHWKINFKHDIVFKKIEKNELYIIAKNIHNELEKMRDILKTIDLVLIENQPTFKNPKMKSISMFLYAFFIQFNTKIRLCSPLKKTKLNEILSNEYLKCATSKSQIYSLTKELGIIYCKTILRQFEQKKDLNMLGECPKRDDLSDAFLQCFIILFPKFIINDNYFNEHKEEFEKKRQKAQNRKKLQEPQRILVIE